jgi:hypothetical protein
MPVIINEIVIRSTVENAEQRPDSKPSTGSSQIQAEELVKQTVAKVLEIIEDKKSR